MTLETRVAFNRPAVPLRITWKVIHTTCTHTHTHTHTHTNLLKTSENYWSNYDMKGKYLQRESFNYELTCSHFPLKAFINSIKWRKLENPDFMWTESHWWATEKQAVLWDWRDKIGNLRASDHSEKEGIKNWAWHTTSYLLSSEAAKNRRIWN